MTVHAYYLLYKHMWSVIVKACFRTCAQLLVDRQGCADNQRLAELGPGSLIEVSEVLGRGCAVAPTSCIADENALSSYYPAPPSLMKYHSLLGRAGATKIHTMAV